MERDAPLAAPIQYEELVPPPSPSAVGRVALTGLGLVAAAAVTGAAVAAMGEAAPAVLATLRIWLVSAGVAAAGYAVALRPDRAANWGLAAAAALLGGGPPAADSLPRLGLVGLPEHWDSLRLMLRVAALVLAAGAGVAAMPRVWRFRAASALIVVHFSGIFLATTSPSPSPWITDQVFNRLYLPYLQFVYLRNAYHFYSPEPGPASLLAFLVKTETGGREVNGVRQKTYDRRWVVFPQRPQDVKDPLGVSYFRRLSITEQVAPAIPGGSASALEGREIRQRRSGHLPERVRVGADPLPPVRAGRGPVPAAVPVHHALPAPLLRPARGAARDGRRGRGGADHRDGLPAGAQDDDGPDGARQVRPVLAHHVPRSTFSASTTSTGR